MMFEQTGRYDHLDILELTTAGGDRIRYRRRRFLPAGEALPLLVEVTVEEGDRLDMIAARVLGDPEQFWRICDANDAMNPFELDTEPGRKLRVPQPQVQSP